MAGAELTPTTTRAAAVTALLLAISLVGGAVTIAREYRRFLADRTTGGPAATVDAFLGSADMGRSEDLLHAVRHARLPATADVLYVARVPGTRADEVPPMHYVVSYLLHPRRVWAVAWCPESEQVHECEESGGIRDLEAVVAAHGVRHVLVAGAGAVPLGRVRTHRLSPSLTLLDLR